MVNHRRGPWSQHEDQWLVSLVHRNGPHNWVRISQEIATRSPKQCRERYHQNLKPSLNHDPITPEEGEQIERMVAEMGKRWAEIARRLNGRSDNAVKNWWNGGQNRRKRNPERPEHERNHTSQSAYHYPAPPHHTESVHPSHHALPSLRDFAEPSSFYSQSRRTSLNPSSNSPRAIKLPHPQAFEPYPGSRPPPLELSSHYASRSRGYETPMPSPGYSVASVDAPSLVTDTGSESRSPRGAPSPLEHSLPPMIGSRDERKNSRTRYLPVSGFAVDDDDLSASFDDRRRASVQLPPLHRVEPSGSAPIFREPNYRPERPQLLTQPASQLLHHHSLPLSAPLPAGQQSLPSYQNLSLPTPQATSPPTASPSSRELPSPFARPALAGQSRSMPSSPRNDSLRDDRMKLNHIL